MITTLREAPEQLLRGAPDQEDAKAISSGRIEVSCADDISSIILEDAKSLAAHYMLDVQMPSEQCRAHLPHRGYVTVLESFLKFEVRFPLNRFFRDT